jgi:hypothetical protein
MGWARFRCWDRAMIQMLVASLKSRIVALVCPVSYWNGVADDGRTYSNFLTSSTGKVAVLLITGRLKSRTMCILWINPWRRT